MYNYEGFRRFTILIFFLWGSLPLAHAYQNTVEFPGVEERQASLNSSQYVECGQKCLYSKANENLALQSVYVLNKLRYLENGIQEAFKKGNLSRATTIVRENLGDFCSPRELRGSMGAKKCFERYKKVQVVQLKRLQAAVNKNSRQISELQDNRERAGALYRAGEVRKLPVVTSSRNEPEKLRHLPNIPTYEELRDHVYAKEKGLESVSSLEYEEWEDHIAHEPSRDDYVKFTNIEVDGEKVEVLDKSCGKEICYDEMAYKEAHKEYLEVRKVMEADFRAISGHEPTFEPAEDWSEESIGRESIDAYNQARGIIVATTNSQLSGDSRKTKLSIEDQKASQDAPDWLSKGQRFLGNEKIDEKSKKSQKDLYIKVSGERLQEEISPLVQEVLE